MRLKSYRARSLAEALRQIERELGPEAVILDSRPVPRQGLRGFLGPEEYEVTAAVDETRALVERLTALDHAVRRLTGDVVKDPLETFRQRLLDAGVSRTALASLPERLPPGEPDVHRLQAALEEWLGPPQPILLTERRCTVVAFVGPTGVGKTTTLAKLAARFAVVEGARVGLITADTYRIAAVQQLATYAEILGVPMEVTAYPHEMAAAVARFREKDLVLIDTGGRSHLNAMQMAELKAMIEAARPDETHLVLALSSDPMTALSQAEAFRRVGVDKVLLTKRDEAERFGLVVNLAHARVGPFSYVTMGQRVPEDIEPFSPRPFARSLLGVSA